MSKGYKDVSHQLNCPPNSLHKMGTKGGSKGDNLTKYSFDKKAAPGGSGLNRPEGFSKM